MKLANALLVSVVFLLTPMKLYALTGGPIQPEFASFEPVDVTDLVNLPSGDFTYVVSLGEVKGPAGIGYPIALSYHGGIMNEQEASWVGLGWTLNAGAINRNIRGGADDANGDPIYSYMYNSGKSGWNFNMGGGFGTVSASIGWSEKGFQGVTSIGMGYSLGPVNIGGSYNPVSGTTTVGIGFGAYSSSGTGIGLNVGVSVGQENVSTYASVGLSSQGQSLAGFSIDSKKNMGFSVGNADFNAASMTKDGLNQSSSGFGLTIPIYNFRVDFSYSSWSWSFEQFSKGKLYGYLYHSPNVKSSVSRYNDGASGS